MKSKEWIKNTGTCPVKKGTLVDVKYREGGENLGVRALLSFDDRGSDPESNAHDWGIEDDDWDIEFWRLHTESNKEPTQ